MITNKKLKLVLCLNYLIYSMVLTTLGIVISQSIKILNITLQEGSYLELYKDLSIILTALILGPLIPKIGFKKIIIISLICTLMALIFGSIINNFWIFKFIFSISGSGFAILMISIYTLADNITGSSINHMQFLNFAEGTFISGTIIGPIIFVLISKFLPWNFSYIFISIFLLASIFSTTFLKFPTPQIQSYKKITFIEFNKTSSKLYTLSILGLILLTVVVDINFLNWIPLFNKTVLMTSTKHSMFALSLFGVFFALGRFISSYVFNFISWFKIIIFCILSSIILIFTVLILSTSINDNYYKSLTLSLLFSFNGFFLGPMMPTISSILLKSMKNIYQHYLSIMIIIVLAIGSSLGTLLIAYISKIISFKNSFYSLLIFQFIIGILITFIKKTPSKVN